MRLLLRPQWPVLALLLLAPSIPELLTGSTPISTLFFDPPAFAINFLGIVGLYGTGALLVREFAVYFRKGWASILLLGAAYGIVEEGLAVHTFFAPPGTVVGALGSYGHLFGVNWLWALGLTVFHATYSIALPILLTQLWYPASKDARWLDRGLVGLVAFVYLFVVVLFSIVVGHGPTPFALAFFLGMIAVLLALAYGVPGNLLSVRPGPRRIGKLGLALAGTLEFDAWLVVLFFSGTGRVPAWAAAALLIVTNLAALGLVLRRVGSVDLERSKFYFAVGMLSVLFAFDVIVEFSIPGILAVSAVFAYLLYRLGGTLARRAATAAAPRGSPNSLT
ncbi:MAG: hypothetical protein ABSB97_03265 [Thermoplasmata archaeon]